MLTPKQKAFCDYYLESGNATDAAIKAGYKKDNARSTASENLTKPYIIDYIKERQKQIEDARIADVAEVMQFFTSVMRGEIADQFGLEAELQTRINAAKEIMKRKERIEDLDEKQKEKNSGKKKHVTVILNRGDLDE